MRLEYILTLIVLAFFFLVIAIAVLSDQAKRKNRVHGKDEEWLFSNWTEKVYDSLTNTDPQAFAPKVGINAKQYMDDCRLLMVYPQLKDLIVKKLTGFASMLFFLILMIVTRNYLFCGFCILFSILLAIFPGKKIETEATNRKMKLANDLPRFLDLLQTALYINLPIEDAILITARNMEDTVIAKEFLATMTDVQLGARDWQESLDMVARRYSVDEFSDFVLELTIAYTKGLSIYETIARRNEDIKKTSVLNTKERATKLNSTLMIPIVTFDLLPMLALMMIPIVIQLNTGFF